MKHGSLTNLHWLLPSGKERQQAHEACAATLLHGDMGELKEKKCHNPTRPTERNHMLYSIVLAGSVQRPSQLSLKGLAVPGSRQPNDNAVQSLWDGAGNVSEPESEEEEMDVE